MELGRYVDEVQRQLVSAVDAGSEEARVVAGRLVVQVDAVVRLVLLDALSTAAGEITRDLAPASVDLRLRGRDVEFVVSTVSPDGGGEDGAVGSMTVDEASTSRTTLRLPDALKSKVDDAAAADGVSVNAWLVRAVAAALQPKQRRSAQRTRQTGDTFAGWAR